MPNIFEISASVKEKVSDPRNTLCNIPQLENPPAIHKKKIASVTRISKHLFTVCVPELKFISTAFNKDFSFEDSEYDKIVLNRCYDSVYFDIQVFRSETEQDSPTDPQRLSYS